ncbi:MAG: hypothetical protein P1U74_04525 [Legionellaceae bacterium]|nr:hypothetical protein [Legionellaceae bacterium]
MLSKQVIPCLVDLGAWANFNKMSFSEEVGYNRWNVAAEALDSESLYILKSADFFIKLSCINEGLVFDLITEIAERDSLLSGSRRYKESGISVLQAVGVCPVLSQFYAEDSAKLYSLVQYLELLFFIEMTLIRQGGASQIKFILPNDEDKYYPDLAQLSVDITSFLKFRIGFEGRLDIQLLCFKYGKRLSNRPYLNTTQGFFDKDSPLSITNIVDDEYVTESPSKECKL